MIKLTSAKCPNCNANIEVNAELEKAICQYCGSTIIIEDVIPKIKIEHSGTVKVDGIKNRDNYFEQAIKHIKYQEYEKALVNLRVITDSDEFDIETYSNIVIADLGILNSNCIDVSYFLKSKSPSFEKSIVDEFFYTIDRLKIIDEKNDSDKILDNYKDDIKNYCDIRDKVNRKNLKIPFPFLLSLIFIIIPFITNHFQNIYVREQRVFICTAIISTCLYTLIDKLFGSKNMIMIFIGNLLMSNAISFLVVLNIFERNLTDITYFLSFFFNCVPFLMTIFGVFITAYWKKRQILKTIVKQSLYQFLLIIAGIFIIIDLLILKEIVFDHIIVHLLNIGVGFIVSLLVELNNKKNKKQV